MADAPAPAAVDEAPAIVLETERLALRLFTIDDAPFVLRLLNQPSFLRFIGDRGVRTIGDARAYIEHGPLESYNEYGFGLYVVTRRNAIEPLGMCGIMRKPWLAAPDIAYAFLPEHEAKGYASEAAAGVLNYARAVLGLDVVLGVVLPENPASIRVLQKLGFELESMVIDPRNNQELQLYAYRS